MPMSTELKQWLKDNRRAACTGEHKAACWCGFQPSQPTTQDVINAIDRAFAPDIRLKLDSRSRIIGVKAVSETGAQVLLQMNLLERNYDDLRLSGVTFEIAD